MQEHITSHRGGFSRGYTCITELDDDTGIEFGSLRVESGDRFESLESCERAFLLMEGSCQFVVDGKSYEHKRDSIFDEAPFCVHVPPKVQVMIDGQAEIAISKTANDKTFDAEVYGPNLVPNEHRGKGQVGGACLRYVRTIFDDRCAHPNSNLVLGEVVNMPGKWSSYPPHHHPQPEIYHYRFTDARGYGHGELGDEVLKVRPFDTVKILDNKDHAQCAAPGYGMYYIWVIRHLPGCRYDVPEFTQEHRWTMEENANFWSPALA